MSTFRPGKPYWLRSLAADLPIGAATVAIPWSVDELDGEFNASSSTVIDVAVDGLYLLQAEVSRTTPPGSQVFWHYIRRNGIVVARSLHGQPTTSQGGHTGRVLQLVDGDQLSVEVSGAQGCNLLRDATFFDVVRIGPVRWT